MIPKDKKYSEFMKVWKKNFVLSECIYVFCNNDGNIEEAIAYFRPAGGFTHFYIRKPLSEIISKTNLN